MNVDLRRTLLMATLLMLAACGNGHEEEVASVAADYHLDPPDLANLLISEIEPGVPVLCYHYFRADFQPGYLLKVLGSVLFSLPALGDREFWTTPRGEFERHLRWFRDSGTRVMTLDEVADLVVAGRPLPRRAVVLTIDDADRSVYELAWPLLLEYGVKAHLFVPTGHVGDDWSSLDVCTWDQLQEMADSGAVLVDSHTRNLHYKVRTDGGWEPVFWHPGSVPAETASATRLEVGQRWQDLREGGVDAPADALLTGPASAVTADLLASRLDVLDGVGTLPRWLSWPYGFANDELDSLACRAGFRGTVSLHPRVFSEQDSLLAVGRITLTAKTTSGQIRNVLKAAAR